MALKLITPASALAVSLAEAKLHLRVTGSAEDALIEALVVAATEMAEQATGTAIMPQTWALTLDAFPGSFELKLPPVASVSSIQYFDADGVLQTLGSALYTLDAAADQAPAYVVPAYGTSWPATRNQVNAVTLQFVAGYANAAAVPDSIKAWIKLQVGAMYENRQASGTMQTYALGFADRLLDRFKVWSL